MEEAAAVETGAVEVRDETEFVVEADGEVVVIKPEEVVLELGAAAVEEEATVVETGAVVLRDETGFFVVEVGEVVVIAVISGQSLEPDDSPSPFYQRPKKRYISKRNLLQIESCTYSKVLTCSRSPSICACNKPIAISGSRVR